MLGCRFMQEAPKSSEQDTDYKFII
uniref:Uncharacterized protein n=1 Tax=Arundo donax TaxID=35708 RepID=A0A0A8ZMI8_ARUDO